MKVVYLALLGLVAIEQSQAIQITSNKCTKCEVKHADHKIKDALVQT